MDRVNRRIFGMSIHMRMIFVILCCAHFARGTGWKQQKFRGVPPPFILAKEGDDVTLPCEIDNRRGSVQWVMDGMALGEARIIPGYPRYRMIGDESKGEFSLQIRNVSLVDEAKFYCQVGRKVISPTDQYEENRISIYLNVTAPPTSIEMIDVVNNSVMAVPQNEELRLKCVVRGSKPPAKVVWYRDKNELKSNYTEEITHCRTALNSSNNAEKCDVLSTLVVKLSTNDESVLYGCRAAHVDLPAPTSMFSNVLLKVIYPPPGPPIIDGYLEGDQRVALVEGQYLELMCRSVGGYPLAELMWLKNDAKLQNTHYITHDSAKVSESKLKIFALQANDNGAVYTCESKNGAMKDPYRTSVRLQVAFGPKRAEISSSTDANAGETKKIVCETSSSNPAADIQWAVDGQKTSQPYTSELRRDDDGGGWITRSLLNVTIPSGRKELLVYCYASNSKSSKNVVANVTIRIHYPPGKPIISGYPKGGYILSGAKQDMICTSSGGNPLAELTWFKNNERITSVTRKSDKTSSFAEITIVANKTDNGAMYKCEARNPTMTQPHETSVRLNVYFAPDTATVSVEPNELRVGTIAKLRCNVSSSNPAAQITWWRKKAFQITDGVFDHREAGEYGGYLTYGELTLNVTADMHENSFTCQATNDIMKRSVNKFVMLNVFYKPIFVDAHEPSNYSKTEGESFAKSFEAKGNPTKLVYRWSKNGQPLSGNYYQENSLVILRLSRQDAGVYRCEAENSEGSEAASFVLDVKYEASITEISPTIMASEGSTIEMTCAVDGNPIESHDVTWSSGANVRDWQKRATETFRNNKSVLRLQNVTLNDMGLFYCVVNNGIGAETNSTTRLIVEHAPQSNISQRLVKVAPDGKGTANFVCRGSGAPKLEFSWLKNNSLINKTSNNVMESRQVNELEYEGTLSIKQLQPVSYGNYSCIIKNAKGHIKIDYELIAHSKPDEPTNLRVVNFTRNSVVLAWDAPHFDGGMPIRYSVQYYSVDNAHRKYKNTTHNETTLVVDQLLPGTTYMFHVLAYNHLGSSNYSSTFRNATTIMESGSQRVGIEFPVDSDGLIILAAAIIGIMLLFLNLLFALICFCRRSDKKKKALMESSAKKSVEMYGPQSRSCNNFSSGTLSSLHSEKSAHFSPADDNRNHINDRDELTIPYVIEDIDYPFIMDYKVPPKRNTKLPFSKLQYDGYSTIGHVHDSSMSHQPMSMPSFEYDVNSTSNVTALRRLSMSHLPSPDLSYLPRDAPSPTPSIPPPMTNISTYAYRSNSFLHL